MKKFVPYEKMSKRAKRETDRAKRKTWNGINPVTRTADTASAYRRRKETAASYYEE